MQPSPSITITFDDDTLTPTAVHYAADTDEVTARLREIVGLMLAALPDRASAPVPEEAKP